MAPGPLWLRRATTSGLAGWTRKASTILANQVGTQRTAALMHIRIHQEIRFGPSTLPLRDLRGCRRSLKPACRCCVQQHLLPATASLLRSARRTAALPLQAPARSRPGIQMVLAQLAVRSCEPALGTPEYKTGGRTAGDLRQRQDYGPGHAMCQRPGSLDGPAPARTGASRPEHPRSATGLL